MYKTSSEDTNEIIRIKMLKLLVLLGVLVGSQAQQNLTSILGEIFYKNNIFTELTVFFG